MDSVKAHASRINQKNINHVSRIHGLKTLDQISEIYTLDPCKGGRHLQQVPAGALVGSQE